MSLASELKAITENIRGQAPAEVFSALQAAITRLDASGLSQNALKPGQRITDFQLPDATGKVIDSADLRQRGKLLISFYRGEWCPYCNLELKTLQDRLADISASGTTLVAISPQIPDYSLSIKQKHELQFPVLSDAGNRVARQFGLVYTLDESLKTIFAALGIDLNRYNGDVSFELPMPATYLIEKDGMVLESFVAADWTRRAEPDDILAWIKASQH